MSLSRMHVSRTPLSRMYVSQLNSLLPFLFPHRITVQVLSLDLGVYLYQNSL